MRAGKIAEEVWAAWKGMPRSSQRMLRTAAMSAANADFRVRAKIVLNLVRGNTPTVIHAVLGCSLSQVYRIARRFVEQGSVGLADGREDNGEAKITEEYEWWLVIL